MPVQKEIRILHGVSGFTGVCRNLAGLRERTGGEAREVPGGAQRRGEGDDVVEDGTGVAGGRGLLAEIVEDGGAEVREWMNSASRWSPRSSEGAALRGRAVGDHDMAGMA